MNNQAWDVQDVRIGSAVRGNGGAPRQGVARSQSAVNAAKRTGTFVGTEKKFTIGNAAKGNTDGQRLTMVDRSDDIVKPKVVGAAVGAAIMKARSDLGLNRKELAAKCFVTESQLGTFESGKANPDQKVLGALERALKVKLRGSDIGAPLGPRKAAAPAPAKGKKGNKAKEEKGDKKADEKQPEAEGDQKEGDQKEGEAQPAEGEAQPAEGDGAAEEVKADGPAA